MKIVQEKPTKGQFVHIYKYFGKIFSAVYRWYDGDLETYIESEDDWSLCSDVLLSNQMEHLGYVVED